jgi:tetratricopeptide (TPR) repeat protein
MILLPLILLLLCADISSADDLTSRARAARLRAQVYLATGAWTEAERQLTALNERFPEDRFVLSDLATACQQLGQIDRADNIYRRLIELYPEAPSYRRNRTYLLFEARRYAAVVELIDAEPEPPTGELRRLLATALDRTGQVERADQFYDAALADSPEDFDLLLMMGERQLGKGRNDRALPYFEQALPLQPRNPRLLKDLALAVQEEDPEQFRQYLLPILIYDRSDAEVPYLLGEFYRPGDPQRAAKYYGEGLRRLQKQEQGATDLYRQSLEARLRYRLGEQDEAERRYRDLLVRHPNATDLRDDLAQLLVEERRWDEALELIASDSTGDRASWLRVAVHQTRGDWLLLADELSILSKRSPESWQLRADLAEALSHTARWPEGLSIWNELLISPPTRQVAERIFEQRRALRQTRGTALGLEGTHTGLPAEGSWGLRPALRWQLTPHLSSSARWIAGLYKDDGGGGIPAFSERVHEGWLGFDYALHPAWEIGLWTRTYSGDRDDRIGFGGRIRHLLRRGGRIEFEGSEDDMWTEPVDAVINEGRFRRTALSLSSPLPLGLYGQTQGSWRSFRVGNNRQLGSELRGSAYLGREIARLPYGASFPLRTLSLSLAFEESRADQEAAQAALIALQKRTRTFSLNLFAHFLFAGRALLDLSLFTGLDPERDLAPGELYGLGVEFHADLTHRLSLAAGGSFASESSLQAAGGTYRQARMGLMYYFDYNR